MLVLTVFVVERAVVFGLQTEKHVVPGLDLWGLVLKNRRVSAFMLA